jgi:DNA-binding GntR family transcriptional regulator
LALITAVSQTEAAYAALRNDILAGRLRPSDRLKIQELCVRLGVSPGAVREALSRLTPEGLVVAEAWKGFRVAPVGTEELEDVTRTRVLIETACLRQALVAGDIAWEMRVVAAQHGLTQISKSAGVTSEEWAHAHADFHLALVEACGSAWLLRLRSILWAQSERYRRLSTTVQVGRNAVEEHSEITAAVLARDVERTCQLMTDHFWRTAKLVRTLSTPAESAAL